MLILQAIYIKFILKIYNIKLYNLYKTKPVTN